MVSKYTVYGKYICGSNTLRMSGHSGYCFDLLPITMQAEYKHNVTLRPSGQVGFIADSVNNPEQAHTKLTV